MSKIPVIALKFSRRPGPIGVDIGSRSVKLVQLSADRTRLLDIARREFAISPAAGEEERDRQVIDALRKIREGRNFRGAEAVVCLSGQSLFVKNVRVARSGAGDLETSARQEVQDRLPYPIAESELRFLETAEIRQGDTPRKEVLVLGCHRPALERQLHLIEAADLLPVAVDVEPLALLRCYVRQFRRDDDRKQRTTYVRVGATSTAVIIAEGSEVLFIKYVEVGGAHFDEAVSSSLEMDLQTAWALRRNNGDRRAELQDPEITRSIARATRPVLDRLLNEISMCLRYHSVTFRGQPIAKIVICGGEATPALVEAFTARLDMRCELGDPLRAYEHAFSGGRRGQWDVAIGLALRDTQALNNPRHPKVHGFANAR